MIERNYSRIDGEIVSVLNLVTILPNILKKLENCDQTGYKSPSNVERGTSNLTFLKKQFNEKVDEQTRWTNDKE